MMWVYGLGKDLDCKMAAWKGMGLPMGCHWDLMLVENSVTVWVYDWACWREWEHGR